MKLTKVTGLAVAGLVLAASAFADTAPATAPADVVWVDEVTIPASLTGVPGSLEGGQAVVTDRGAGNCVACHEIASLPQVDFQGNVGPALTGVGSRWNEAELRGILVNAKHMFPESRMPSFYRDDLGSYTRPGDEYTGRAANPETFGPLLSAQQVEDTVAYLVTLTD